MGISSDGQLNYGICFDEEFGFPWNINDDEDDIELWWENVLGFKHTLPSPFDENGNWKKGVEDRKAFYEWNGERDDFMKANPIPIEMHMHCSYDYPMYIMTLPKTGFYNSRGDATEIKLHELNNFHSEIAIATIKEFCKKYEIESEFKFSWWLTSLYG